MSTTYESDESRVARLDEALEHAQRNLSLVIKELLIRIDGDFESDRYPQVGLRRKERLKKLEEDLLATVARVRARIRD